MTNHTQTGERVYNITEERSVAGCARPVNVVVGALTVRRVDLTDQEAGQIAEAMQAAYDDALAHVLGARRRAQMAGQPVSSPATVREAPISVKPAQVMAAVRNIARVCKELYDRPVLS